MIQTLLGSEAAGPDISIATLRRVAVIEIEGARVQRRPLCPANGRRVAIGAGKMHLLICDDRVHKDQDASGQPHQEYARRRREDLLDDADSTIDETTILIQVACQSDI